jgi:hypothetical protein
MTAFVLPTANTAMMQLFLEHIAQTFAASFMVMQVDRAGWHEAKTLVVPENIRLIPQPAYSPEVNPVEHRCRGPARKTVSESGTGSP